MTFSTTDECPIELIPLTPQHFLALLDGADSYGKCFGHAPAEGLRDFIVSGDIDPAFFQLLQIASGEDPWLWGFAIVDKASGLSVGNAGFKGAPCEQGIVEIAYCVVPSFENRGIATRAAGKLVEFARLDARVRTILAHTLPEPNASTHVLSKNGFIKIGDIEDPTDGPIWRWEYKGNW